MYAGVDYPDRGGSFVETYYIRDADMNLTKIPEGVTLEQAVMVPDMMCTAFEGVQALNMKFGQSVAVLGIGPVGLMAVRAAVLQGAGNIFAIGSRQACFDVAKVYGATHLVDYHNEDYIDRIIRENGGPVDNVVLCGGSEKELSLGLKKYNSPCWVPRKPFSWFSGGGVAAKGTNIRVNPDESDPKLVTTTSRGKFCAVKLEKVVCRIHKAARHFFNSLKHCIPAGIRCFPHFL